MPSITYNGMQVHVKKIFKAISFLLQNVILIKPSTATMLSCVPEPNT